jgi:hypothetical protein
VAKKKSDKKIGGPFLGAAVFCENFIDDASGKISALNILDSVTAYLPPDTPQDVPSKEQPIGLMQNALLIFRTGDAPGKHHLRVTMTDPSDERAKAFEREIELSAESHGGIHIKTRFSLSIPMAGLYWFDVFLDGKRVTRMALKVTLLRLPAEGDTIMKAKGSAKK